MIVFEKFNIPPHQCPGWETISEDPRESQASYHSAIGDSGKWQSAHGLILNT